MTATRSKRTRWAFGENVTFKDGWTKTWEGDVWLKEIGPVQVAIHVPPQRGGSYQVLWYKGKKQGVIGGSHIRGPGSLTEAKRMGDRYIKTLKGTKRAR